MIRRSGMIVGAMLCAGILRTAFGASEPDGVLPFSAKHVQSLAATCAACHGTNGHPVRGSKVPVIAGLSQDYFVMQMRAYFVGTTPSTVMQQIAKGYDERETAALAAYFAAQKSY